MSRKYNVLFVCRANAARSIMAEALLRQLAPQRFEAFSGGVEPADAVHPMTLAQLRPTIADLDRLRPKDWQAYTASDSPKMDIVIGMCDEMLYRTPPTFHGEPVFCYWDFPDPLEVQNDQAEQKRMFERVFRQILRRVSVFVALPLHSMRRNDQVEAVNSAGASLTGPVTGR